MSNRRDCGDYTTISATLFARERREEEEAYQAVMRTLATAAPILGLTLGTMLMFFLG